jgi:hypothetical protein
MRSFRLLGLSTVGLLLLACGSNGGTGFGDGGDEDSGLFVDDGGLLGDGSGLNDGHTCVGLECQIVNCGGGTSTTLSGTVITGGQQQYGAPDPVYNAIVYVPNTAVDPFKAGVACEKCGVPVSGNPVAITLTDSAGKFTLKDVPVGASIPLVVQIGRWRRQVTIPNVPKCVNTPLTADQTRLPRNKKEGDIPHIAIATSVYDAEECILLKMGVDAAEFTVPSGTGRIHLFHGNGSTLPGIPDKAALYADYNALSQYDIVQFPCASVPQVGASPGAAGDALKKYLDNGGRSFVTDLSYSWYKDGPTPFPSTAQWTTWGGVNVNPLPSLIDTSFPKGKALADWLMGIGATTQIGHIDLHETYHVVDGVNAPTARWLYSTSPATVQTLSFNTPVGSPAQDQCGRAFYSNFHIANGQGGGQFPAGCNASPLTPQETVMEFLLLDLSSCVQKDSDVPVVPPR